MGKDTSFEPDDTQTRQPERRRTRRTARSVPVQVCFGATTAVVNRNGALILSPQPLDLDTRVTLTCVASAGPRAFRVAWCGERTDGFYKIGLEMLESDPGFWGDGPADDGLE